MEGRAPSRELKSMFGRFRKWLLAIYRKAVNLNAPLTDEVRGVFDRMLASEAEISQAARKNGLAGLTRKELKALGLVAEEVDAAEKLPGSAREKALAALREARDRGRRRRLRRLMKQAREEVAGMQVYQAIRAMRDTPLDIDAMDQNFGPELEAREDEEFEAAEYLLAQEETARQMELAERQLAGKLGLVPFGRKAFEVAAGEEMGRMAMGNAMRPGRYLAAMRRNFMQFRKCLLEGRRQEALEYNRKALLNYEFARQAQELVRTAEKLRERVKRFVASKSAGADARYFVNEIAAKCGLTGEKAALARGRNQDTILDWVGELKADGVELFIDDRLALGEGKPWREMGVDEFGDLVETLTQIIHAERNQRRISTARGKVSLDRVADEIASSIYASNSTRAIHTIQSPPGVAQEIKRLHALHTKVEALCLAVDGEKMGPAWEHIYKPINEAEDDQGRRLARVRGELKRIFSVYSSGELGRMGSRKVLDPAIGEKISHENRICMALNMGNRENLERLRAGHNWTDAQIAAVVKPLTARDWNFVQAVWDYLETFRKESFDLQQAMTGIRPKAVQPAPFEVRASDGRTIRMRGGYYPIRYNPAKGERAFQLDEKQLDRELFGGRNYGAAQTRKGHLQARSSAGLGTPLLLRLSVVPDHVFNVVHDLAYRRAVNDVARVIRHPAVVKAFEDTVGRELYHQLRPWLQDVANEHQAPMGGLDGLARWARVSTSIMQMGYKITTMVTQVMGITQTMDVLGYKWTAVGVKTVYGNFWKLPALARETFARSSFMAGRIQSFDRDVRDITKVLDMGGLFGWVDVIKSKAFVPMGYLQMGVDLPTWWGAYAKGLKDFSGDEARAAEYADSIVRQAQGSGATKDLARIQRGSELARLFTMFYSYFNTLYNLGARSIRGLKRDHSPAGIFRAANSALLLWFPPCLLTELLAGCGPDDDEDRLKWAGALVIQYPFQAVVGLRDLASGTFGEFGYQLSAAQSAPKSFATWAHAVKKALEKDDPKLLARPTAEAVGYAFSLPMKQAIITLGNLWNWFTGEDPDFAVRDLFFVKRKSPRTQARAPGIEASG